MFSVLFTPWLEHQEGHPDCPQNSRVCMCDDRHQQILASQYFNTFTTEQWKYRWASLLHTVLNISWHRIGIAHLVRKEWETSHMHILFRRRRADIFDWQIPVIGSLCQWHASLAHSTSSLQVTQWKLLKQLFRETANSCSPMSSSARSLTNPFTFQTKDLDL